MADYYNATTNPGGTGFLLGKGDTGNTVTTRLVLSVQYTGTAGSQRITSNLARSGSLTAYASVLNAWPLDQWVFLAATFDDSRGTADRYRHYVACPATGLALAQLSNTASGVTITEGAGTFNSDTNGLLGIGGHTVASNATRTLPGDLGPVGYYPGVLSLAEIQAIMDGTIPTGATAPVVYLPLTETSGTVANDTSGAARHGTMIGTTVATSSPPVTPTLASPLVITPANQAITGATQQYAGTGTYSDGSTAPITDGVWSQAGTTSTINSAGLLTRAAQTSSQQSGTVTLTKGGVTGSTGYTIPAVGVTLATIAIAPLAPSVPGGTTRQFILTATRSDGSTEDVTSQATWSHSLAGGSIGAATGLYTAPAATGAVQVDTITATFGGKTATTTATVAAGAMTVARNLSDSTPITATSATVSVASPVGGSGSYTFAWHRSTTAGFTPGSGTLVADQTGATATFTSLTPGITYWVACIVSDGTTAITTYRRAVAISGLAPLRILRIGDSTEDANASLPNFPNWINGEPGPPSRHLVSMLRSRLGPRVVAVTNRAIAGTSSGGWLANSTNLNAALAAFAAAGDWVLIRLGVNDSQGAISAATFTANLTGTVNACVAAGYRVQLDAPTTREPGAALEDSSVTFDDSTAPYLVAYLAAIEGLVNGTTIFRGDFRSFATSATAPTTFLYRSASLPGGIHEIVDGAVTMAGNAASALLVNAGLQDVASAPTAATSVGLTIPTGTIGTATLGAVSLLGGSAPTTATTITLTATGATVPATLTIPANAPSATFALTPAAASFTVAATAPGLTGSGTITRTAVAVATASAGMTLAQFTDFYNTRDAIDPTPDRDALITAFVNSTPFKNMIKGQAAATAGGEVVLAANGLDAIIVEPAGNGQLAVNARQALAPILASVAGRVTGAGAKTGTGAFTVLSPTGVARITGMMNADERTFVTMVLPA